MFSTLTLSCTSESNELFSMFINAIFNLQVFSMCQFHFVDVSNLASVSFSLHEEM